MTWLDFKEKLNNWIKSKRDGRSKKLENIKEELKITIGGSSPNAKLILPGKKTKIIETLKSKA